MKVCAKGFRGTVLFGALASSLLVGCGGGGLGGGGEDTNYVLGEAKPYAGARLLTYARTNGDGRVIEVAVEVPYKVVSTPPTSDPVELALDFPDEVKDQTFFNHFSIKWNANGRQPPRYAVPLYDFTFFGISQDAVAQIGAVDPKAPDANRVPAGYTYPGVDASVPKLGTRVVPDTELDPGAPAFDKAMAIGFHDGSLVFLEPMTSQDWLKTGEGVEWSVPKPAFLGRNTRYPRQVNIDYIPGRNMYIIKFSDFELIN